MIYVFFGLVVVFSYIGLIQWVVDMLMKQYDRFDEGDDGETE